jgi:hypothetical protein
MVLTLLVIIVASWFSLWKLYTILQRIEKKLNSTIEQSNNKVGKTNDTSNR